MDTGIDGVSPDDGWSALVFTRVLPGFEPLTKEQLLGWDGLQTGMHIPVGHVFVIERHKHDPLWKLPGGHKQGDETPLQTAVRELHGEAGVRLIPEAFTYCAKWRRERRDRETGELRRWWDLLFVALMRESDYQWMGQPHDENEGEEPGYFTTAKFRGLVQNRQFLPKHLSMLQESALIV